MAGGKAEFEWETELLQSCAVFSVEARMEDTLQGGLTSTLLTVKLKSEHTRHLSEDRSHLCKRDSA